MSCLSFLHWFWMMLPRLDMFHLSICWTFLLSPFDQVVLDFYAFLLVARCSCFVGNFLCIELICTSVILFLILMHVCCVVCCNINCLVHCELLCIGQIFFNDYRLPTCHRLLFTFGLMLAICHEGCLRHQSN